MSDIRAAQVHGIDQLFSEESYRNKTFANFPGSCPVSSTTLARAGFYYTGDGDTVKCFSCHLTVQGWQYGESAIGKHRKLSPNCTFINSFYPNSEQIQTSSPVLQSSSPWVADNCSGSSAPGNSFHMVPNTDADYLLRTGQVVDMSDTMYPRNPAMCNEAARLASFISWPDYSPLKPKELAHAGLYYKGIADQVECFCCGGKLKNWEPGDRPLAEHKKHFPRCLFVQGRKTGVPHESNGVDEEWCILNGTEIPAHQEMTALEKRLETFQSWMFPISKQDLAKSGFYSLGDADSVMCFYCGGGLRDWKPSDDPWQQHAKWYPGCKYLIDQKGVEFVNHVQLNKGSNGDIEMEPVEEASPLNKADTINQSPMVQDALQMGFNLSTIQTLMENKLKTTGENYKSTELLVADLLNETTQDKSNEVNPPKKVKEVDIEETLRRLQEEKICKVCMDRNVSVVFIPCGHLVTCNVCAEEISKCPICCTVIQRRQKIFMS